MLTNTYEQLRFSDDFMFCKVLQNNPDLCKELLELILGDTVGSLIAVNQQETIRITPNRKGVRFDVYAKDDNSVIYDVEMQNAGEKDLAKRVRYSQSLIDLEEMEQGARYENLNQSYIIYICNFNLFPEKGRHRYSFRNLCIEDREIELSDGTEKIFLCTKGTRSDITERMQDFLQYVSGEKANDDFTKRLEDAVEAAKRNASWRKEFMDLQDYMDIAEKRGIEKGRAEGIEEGRALERERSRLLEEENKQLRAKIAALEKNA